MRPRATPEKMCIRDSSQSDHDDIEHFSLRLTYYLKDGSQLSRSYSLYLRRSDLTVPDVYKRQAMQSPTIASIPCV